VLDLDDTNDEVRSPRPTPRDTTHSPGQQQLSWNRDDPARPRLPVTETDAATALNVQVALSWSYIDEQNQVRSGVASLDQVHDLPIAVRSALLRKLRIS
jgi:hypothetical protein